MIIKKENWIEYKALWQLLLEISVNENHTDLCGEYYSTPNVS